MDRQTIRENRNYLRSMEAWITPEIYRNSRNHYGCPPRALSLLNAPIDEQPTYTDLLVHAARRLAAPVRYLELGVSVGKNFFVMAQALSDAILIGFDWEQINPLLEQRLDFVGASGSMRWYRCGSNEIGYLQGDIASPHDWSQLAGRRFNLLFSDACHQPEMLKIEFAMLQHYDLLDPAGFVVVWDDLDRLETGPVTQAYREIADALAQRYHLPPAAIFRLQLNGWLGQHEHRHTVGIVNGIGLTAAAFA